MFKVVQQLEFINLFFPCCRFSPLPSATPKLMQAFWTFAPCLMFPIVPLLLLSAPIPRSPRMSPDPRHMCTLSTPTVGINWLFYGTWLSFKPISFRNLRQELWFSWLLLGRVTPLHFFFPIRRQPLRYECPGFKMPLPQVPEHASIGILQCGKHGPRVVHKVISNL